VNSTRALIVPAKGKSFEIEEMMFMNSVTNRRTWLRATTSLIMTCLLLGAGVQVHAKKVRTSPDAINLVPTVNAVSVQNGQLVATGTATATVGGQTVTVPFTVPLKITTAPTVGCPVLDLTLGPIDLDLLGLHLVTSPICLDIIAIPGGGLLGDLLCNVGNLLQSGISIEQILAGAVDTISPKELSRGLSRLLNGVLGNLLGSILQQIGLPTEAGTCNILHLELEPLSLNLLGLQIDLDNCQSGSVVVDITGENGQVLGDLLCGLLGDGGIDLGATLQQILNGLLGALAP
jgi:hypothetical protein